MPQQSSMTLTAVNDSQPKLHPFDRSGLAALSDLKSPEWEGVFRFLEKEQIEFLAHEKEFRSPEYLWPRDPLHTWSRLWEYPYVYHHLKNIRAGLPVAAPRILDCGSGVTFFPFSAARLGFHVTCADVDPICERDLARAARVIPHNQGMVDFSLITGNSLPFGNREIDVVVCISVLEHIPNFEVTISEMARVLKPGGALILTIDLDLRGDAEIGAEKYNFLVSELKRYFDFSQSENVTHPADLLTSSNSPFPPIKHSALQESWFQLKQSVKPIIGLKPRHATPFYLAVQGFVMRKNVDEKKINLDS